MIRMPTLEEAREEAGRFAEKGLTIHVYRMLVKCLVNSLT